MREALQQYFGFDRFRDGQEQVVSSLLDGRSVLAVFPTGGGKSLCYQLPALMFDGLTLVVSPLIALMKDQVDSLKAKGIAAARLDSTLESEEVQALFQQLEAGQLKLLYIAPERLSNEAFRRRLSGVALSMLAVDEAHCISEWGHNFRPDYLKVARFCRDFRIPRVLALTATATPNVARDICKQFEVLPGDHVQLSFHRANLDLRVTPCEPDQRKRVLVERLAAIDGPVVVYVTRQETAEHVATHLQKAGLSAGAYHAGLPNEFRSDTQQRFMAGDLRIIVATIAFGMGIDKADIRGVIHYNLPKCLENYSQEIGRAGRDGMPAVCEMLACGDDLTVLRNFIYSDTPSERALTNLLDRILRLGDDFDLSHYDLSVSCDIRNTVIATVLAYLECDGILEATGRFYGNYRVKLLRSREKVLAGMPRAQQAFLKRLLDIGKEGRSWISFEPSLQAAELGVDRAKVLAALRDLESSGDAALAVSGVRHAYRLLKAPGNMRDLARRYTEIFQQREQADLARLQQVLDVSAQSGCLTAYLLDHFGELMEGDCGHCDRCRGRKPLAIEPPQTRELTVDEWSMVHRLVAEGHSCLGSPRQLARFLCGMTSPASTRARLSRHDAFGVLEDLPFADALVIAETL